MSAGWLVCVPWPKTLMCRPDSQHGTVAGNFSIDQVRFVLTIEDILLDDLWHRSFTIKLSKCRHVSGNLVVCVRVCVVVCYIISTISLMKFSGEFSWMKSIFIWISLKIIHKDRIDNNPALVQIMAWRRIGDRPLSEPMLPDSLMHVCGTREDEFRASNDNVYVS